MSEPKRWTLRRWLCCSKATSDPNNWAVSISGLVAGKPPFAVRVISEVEVTYNSNGEFEVGKEKKVS